MSRPIHYIRRCQPLWGCRCPARPAPRYERSNCRPDLALLAQRDARRRIARHTRPAGLAVAGARAATVVAGRGGAPVQRRHGRASNIDAAAVWRRPPAQTAWLRHRASSVMLNRALIIEIINAPMTMLTAMIVAGPIAPIGRSRPSPSLCSQNCAAWPAIDARSAVSSRTRSSAPPAAAAGRFGRAHRQNDDRCGLVEQCASKRERELG